MSDHKAYVNKDGVEKYPLGVDYEIQQRFRGLIEVKGIVSTEEEKCIGGGPEIPELHKVAFDEKRIFLESLPFDIEWWRSQVGKLVSVKIYIEIGE